MNPLLIELHYLPCIRYFAAIERSSEIIVERHENFIKQTYRNRCYINTANGVGTLIVPLVKGHGKIPIAEVRIDHRQKWLINHWRAIQSSYGKAPFFEYYSEELHGILFSGSGHLYDLNYRLLTMCLSWLKLSVTIKESETYEKEPSRLVTDMRSTLDPKKSGELNSFPKFTPYMQVFGKQFVPDLSIIDLIFCLGPDAHNYIHQMNWPMNK